MKKIKATLGMLLLTTLTMSFTDPGDWILFTTKDCKISFPKKPSEQSQILNTAIGQLQLNIYSYEADDNEKDDNLVYMLMETAYPDSVINSDKKEMLENFFRKSIDGAVNNVHGKLLTESIIQYEDFPGREVRVDFRDGLAVIKMRFYLVKNKMFVIQTITDTKNDFNKSIDKFMDSFQLVN
ncbi:MAG TPA: hypothetical protein VFW07_01475 [Parafilimonas sp.]|nr:hypothetical protein [Parafilimonas sp.]